MCWMAGDDPVRINAYEQMPLIEYWAMLNKRVAEAKQEMERAKKSSSNGRRNSNRVRHTR
jgi:hypothetical protein